MTIVMAVLVAAVAYGAIPRRADLTTFAPETMARLETSMWRNYYDKRYLALFLDLYEVSRDQQGFSPLDSVRIAVAAARAAAAFQPTRSRAEADAALPRLETYFRIMARAALASADTRELARTELAWWQARREALPPEQYAAIIARVTTLLYGIDGDDIRRSSLVRAQAMEFRDARSGRMTEADWLAIEDRLRLAYGLLQKALSSSSRQR
jgi:hypothetical protein